MIKPTWVFVAGTYRTASTTQYQIARDIVEETKSGKGIGYHTELKLQEFNVPGPRYIVCKVFEFLPDGFGGKPSYGRFIHKEKRMKALVTLRDPRDIMVSMCARDQRRGVNFDFKKTATKNLPTWLSNAEKWINLGPVTTYYSRFEEFTLNLYTETRNIAGHLDIELDNDHAKTIAARYTIRGIQAKKRAFRDASQPDVREDPWLPSIPGIVFGASGQWQTWLNGVERKLVEESSKGFMKRFGYE